MTILGDANMIKAGRYAAIRKALLRLIVITSNYISKAKQWLTGPLSVIQDPYEQYVTWL